MSRPSPEDLRATPYFLGCTSGELAELARLTELIQVEPGDLLAEHGAPAGDVHLILVGQAESVPHGERWGPGDFVGELAVLQRDRQPATVVAMTPMGVLRVHGPDSQQFLALPAVALHLSWTLGQRLRLR